MPRMIMLVCGPSGAGKSTVVRGVNHIWADLPDSKTRMASYVEDTSHNPFLRDLLSGSTDFDAAGNQHWFLDRVAGFIERSSALDTVVIDQHPAAIVEVYARLFRSDGRLAEGAYRQLGSRLSEIEARMRQRDGVEIVMQLDAPASTLRRRASRRRGAVPPVEWYERLRQCFLEFAPSCGNVVHVSTEELTVRETVLLAASLLERKS